MLRGTRTTPCFRLSRRILLFLLIHRLVLAPCLGILLLHARLFVLSCSMQRSAAFTSLSDAGRAHGEEKR
jgi:hypothetical protein